MKCTFCQHELTREMLRSEGCGACIGGCRKIHCPYCGEDNPVLPDFFDKLLTREPPDRGKGNGS